MHVQIIYVVWLLLKHLLEADPKTKKKVKQME